MYLLFVILHILILKCIQKMLNFLPQALDIDVMHLLSVLCSLRQHVTLSPRLGWIPLAFSMHLLLCGYIYSNDAPEAYNSLPAHPPSPMANERMTFPKVPFTIKNEMWSYYMIEFSVTYLLLWLHVLTGNSVRQTVKCLRYVRIKLDLLAYPCHYFFVFRALEPLSATS